MSLFFIVGFLLISFWGCVWFCLSVFVCMWCVSAYFLFDSFFSMCVYVCDNLRSFFSVFFVCPIKMNKFYWLTETRNVFFFLWSFTSTNDLTEKLKITLWFHWTNNEWVDLIEREKKTLRNIIFKFVFINFGTKTRQWLIFLFFGIIIGILAFINVSHLTLSYMLLRISS